MTSAQKDEGAVDGVNRSSDASAPLHKSDFHYHLPRSLIAQSPLPERAASRLLVLKTNGETEHRRFVEIADLLQAGDLLVVNDTRVIKARLMVRKESGGRAEILIERIEGECQALCQVRVNRALRAGMHLLLEGHCIRVLGREGEFYRLDFGEPVSALVARLGSIPLPPYIDRTPDEADEERYQTVYAAVSGAVAAPTAGLHFDAELLAKLEERGIDVARITLHVGAGTFQPVREEDLSRHHMHTETYAIPEATRHQIDACTGRVVAVGTTVVRTLETAAQSGQDAGETELFITPGYRFRAVDALITNFHLPESTLLMLVSAFAGVAAVRNAYQTAIEHRYRFFSYGDAMWCERAGRENVAE